MDEREKYEDYRNRPSLKPGTVVSHYVIETHLGSGGMSEVYRAEDTTLHRPVALKFLRLDLAADPDFRRRFEREATGIALINHPNVAVIHEIGAHDDRPFFAMEYIEGQTLREILAADSLPFPEVIAIAARICDGLAAIHDRNMVHRDIKPSNIVLDAGDRPRILDFGIAASSEQKDLSGPGLLAGTLQYLSPEQIRGDPASPATDLFSLGIILYQMLTGRMPFECAYEAALKYAILNETPVSPDIIRPDIPAPLAAATMKLLAKNPADRYSNARQAAASLRGLLAPSDRTDYRPPAGKSGRKIFVSLILPAAAVILAVVVIALLIGYPSRKPPSSPTRLAVLPFKNLGVTDDEYFSEGITDAIITRLATADKLRVISRQSSVLYKESGLGYKEIGSELDVRFILTGTVFWDRTSRPELIRINAQLIRTDDGSFLWGETYKGVREKVIALQADIAEEVTSVLKIALSEADRLSIMAIPTKNAEAYDLFLRGNHYFNRSWDQTDILNATEMFQQAIEADSGFALAYAMLSRGHESLYWEYYDRSPDRCRQALWAAEKSLAIEPGLTEGHLALGYIFYHCEQNYDRAMEEFRRALTGRPDCADLYNAIAAVERRQGKLAEAAADFSTALELDPRSPLKSFDIALTYGMMRRFDETMNFLDKTLALAPDWPLPYVYKAWNYIFYSGDTASARQVLAKASGRADLSTNLYYWWLSRIVESDLSRCLSEARPGTDTVDFFLHHARINRLLGRHDTERIYADSARAILEIKMNLHPDDPRFHSQLGLAYAGLRRQPDAMAHAQRAVELLPTTRDAFDALFLVINLAETMVIFGEYDTAIDQLEYLMSIPGFISAPYLRLDPLWVPLRPLPRFQKMIGQK